MSIVKKLPNKSEERAILKCAKESTCGMNELIKKYKILVDVNANKWKRINHFNDSWKDDLCQEGYIGLMRAAKTYDEKYNTRFTTWAILCIQGAIRNMIRVNSNHEHTISLQALLNSSSSTTSIEKSHSTLNIEGLFASETTDPYCSESLEDQYVELDLSKLISNRELDLVRIRYNLEV